MSSNICRIIKNSTTDEVTYSFDPAHLKVSEPKKLTKGKFAGVRYKGNALYLETPLLYSPMTVASYEGDGKKRSMFVSCRGVDDKPEVKAFVDALESVQSTIVDQITEMKAIGKDFPRSTILGIMNHIIKHTESYPPSFRVILNFNDDKPTFDIFRKDRQSNAVAVNFDDIELKGASVRLILCVNNVWIVNNNWGVSVKCTQMLVKPAFSPSTGKSCFASTSLNHDDDEDEQYEEEEYEEDDLGEC